MRFLALCDHFVGWKTANAFVTCVPLTETSIR
jgi:hypothetical protein